MTSFVFGGLMSSYENYTETAKSYDTTRIPMGIEIILGGLASGPCRLDEAKLLDAGCGTGSYSAVMVDFVGHVFGVDLNAEMLSVAKSKLPSEVSLQQAPIDDLPFEDAWFDGIMVNQVLHHITDESQAHFPRLRKILEEFARVLKPGGRVSINTCTHEQLRGGWWYYNLIPDALQEMCDRHIPLDCLRQLLTECHFQQTQTYVPVDALMQGSEYFNPKGPLSKTWRDGDSIWACAKPEELKQALAKLQALDATGQLERYVQEQDQRRQHIGQFTFVLAARA